jgi:GH35 family endo-1,4-beta-xylanase
LLGSCWKTGSQNLNEDLSPCTKNLKQAAIYKDIFEACIESGVCHKINFWGVGDKYSWYVYALNTPDAHPTILNDNISPKPAYYAVIQVLYERLL